MLKCEKGKYITNVNCFINHIKTNNLKKASSYGMRIDLASPTLEL